MALFETTADVEAWAQQHGGLEAVNEALARGLFGNDAQSIRTAIRYVEREELKIAEKQNRGRAMDSAEIAAKAAQRSARQALVSSWIAVIAAIIAVVAVVLLAIR